jgi:AraC family transcriptional regulator
MNYMANMQRAVEFINVNVNEELNLDAIARRAYMSKSYFSKIFRVITGCSVKEYVTAYRLYLAAQDLLMTDKKIIDIAFQYGFNSQQTFTKAFRKSYGMPPGSFRTTKMPLIPLKHLNLYFDGGINMESIFKNVQFIEKEEICVIGVEVKIDYNTNGHNQIGELWDMWVKEKAYSKIPNPINYPVTMGMTEETSKEDTAIYRICMEVESLDNIPVGFVGKVMPKATYAVFRLTLDKLQSGEFWQYFYKKWLPESGYEQPGALVTQNGWQETSRAQIEVYSNVTCTKDEEIEIYAPIIK